MQVIGDYQNNGYALLQGLLPIEICQAFLQDVARLTGDAPIPLSGVDQHVNLLRRPAFEIYGHSYSPMLFFLWGLTPLVSQIVGRDLLPTYDYFRIYREGDVCKVHGDRYSCQHSLSLTLDYSDGAGWPLEVGTEPRDPSANVDDDWGEEPHSAVEMAVGDAVLYQGVEHRHARTMPNPNGWSAHLFLHWVERDGPYAGHAFDGQMKPAPTNFRFA